MALAFGELAGRIVSTFWETLSPNQFPVGGTFANGPALAACTVPSKNINAGATYVTADGARWVWSATSTATDATSQLVVAMADGGVAGAGRWLRADGAVNLKLAVANTTLDTTVLYTVPVGFRLLVGRAFWEVTLGWSGGTNSAIGLSSSNAAYSTKGDLLGGSGGEVAATLITASPGPFVGTIGAKVGGASPVVLVAGNTVIFNRVVDAFSAGSGDAHLPCSVIAL